MGTMLRNKCMLCAQRWANKTMTLTPTLTSLLRVKVRALGQAWPLVQTVEVKMGGRTGGQLWRTLTLTRHRLTKHHITKRHRLACTMTVVSLATAGTTVWFFSGGSFPRGVAGLTLTCSPAQCQGMAVLKPAPQLAGTVKTAEVRQTWFRRLYSALLMWMQLAKVCVMFGPLFALYPLTFTSSRLHRLWLRGVLCAVQRCGPVYIKLGQWASTRRDLFSPEFCQLFSSLLSAVQPHSWSHTERALLRAYGKRWHEVIKMDPSQQPLGSGCIAQVYKGYVHVDNLPAETLEAIDDTDTLDDLYFKDGVEIQSLTESWSFADDCDVAVSNPRTETESSVAYEEDPNYVAVAVKVIHPDTWWQMRRDLRLLRSVARALETVAPSLHWVSLSQCVAQFSVSLTKQMDMVHEARCMKRFLADFADIPYIRIPVPFMSLVRQNILVESFEEGVPIGDFITDQEPCPDGLKEKLADMGVDALLHMVFVKNFVHGDLHPGNILVQNSHTFSQQTEDSMVLVDVGDVMMATVSPKDSDLRLVLLDCGITATLDAQDRDKFTQVFTAVVKGQGEVVADLFLEKSHNMQCKDPEAFRRDMAQLVNAARNTTLQLSKLKVTALLTDVFSVLSKHHIQLESNFATLMLAMGIVEGLGRSLNPHLNILNKASKVLLGQVI